ncbi:peptidase U32 family protein [Candidatus Azobacteroides pseudotrichonymphae]|uniref:Collagenase-like family U32 peptidase n=1 Tax=Azobacteroides pseudotrichonymphae genomovar. CFP2 TaxID=511995 RepID=B6YRP5_AZOPC|nr:peptidase U32 family protein [Candidatus Azobacteroides pseudotrichonymphae]BAG83867.1 collagenase-like family U32 peptidase [Candidatus Azobacteroides pseudotrichonymphae genomovar. CFP2]
MAKSKIIEVMAPIGSYESLSAAIQGGADSVYFGIEDLNMRSNSTSNFTIEDILKIVPICQQHQIKTYLAVNTILYNNDLVSMRAIINAARDAGISAIIAADVAGMLYARDKGMEIHLSTQLNISNIESLRFYAQFADVVVLARELTLEQVKEIRRQIVEQKIKGPSSKLLRIEAFAHGALCMAISGKCYLSLHEMNSSANRGKCNQVCRRGYIVKDKQSEIELEIDNQYIFSSKDLKTIRFIDKMIDSGIEIFKIEGRARGPEYVRVVTECYKKAIKAYFENNFTEKMKDTWDGQLRRVFNRGFWNGYYLGQRLGEWSNCYGNEALEKKMYIGKVVNYFPKIQVGEFLMETQELHKGDKVLITGPTTGALFLKANEIRVNLLPVETAAQGERFSMPVSEKIRPSDKIFKITNRLR